MTCRPARWLWGVPPLALVAALSLVGVKGEIEHDLRSRAAAAFHDAGFYWAVPSFEGRDAVLDGISFSRLERDNALNILRKLWGVRTVTDRTNLIASPETYSWIAIKEDKRVKIRGYVPTENDRRTILGFVAAAVPGLEVDDKMVLAGGSPNHQTWLSAVSYALVQLGQLKSGSVKLDGISLTVDGVAATSEGFNSMKTSLAIQLPAGMNLKSAQIAPPEAKPYEWRVKYTGQQISFEGHVPSEEMHAQIRERTRNLFPHATISGDTMELASGAPEGWSWAVSASLTQLHRLESGRVKLKDTVVEFEGVAADKFTAKNVTASVQHGLPLTYKSSEKITVAQKPGSATDKAQ